jgi:alpha-1,6-mannosyltransferase
VRRAVRVSISAATVAHRSSTPALLACVAVVEVSAITFGPSWPWLLDAAAIVAAGAGLILLSHRSDLTIASVVGAVVAVVAVAVLAPPRGSGDVWSYAMYGRIAGVHHADAFARVPATFPLDPFLSHVSHGWRETTSIYGPGFIALAAAGMRIAHDSFFVARLWFQLLGAGALTAVLALVWRRTRDPRAIAVIGLHPVVVLTAVNGAHNDLLVGLAVLGGVLLAERGHPVLAGGTIALGALVKLTALLGVVALAIWEWQSDRRRAAMSTTAAAVVLIAGHGGLRLGELRAVRANSRTVSRASPWQVGRLLLGLNRPAHVWPGVARAATVSVMATVATSVLLVVVVAVARRLARAAGLRAGVVGALAAYGVVGAYVLPWYACWWLPAALLDPDERAATYASVWATALLAAYAVPRGFRVAGGTAAQVVVSYVLPILVIVGFARYVLAATKRAPAALP